MKIRVSASLYFAFQGATVVAWWLLLVFLPVSRKYFQMGETETVLLAFWLPDLFLLGIGSLLAAYLCFRENKFATPLIWFVVGTLSYATFYCLSFALMTDSGWLGVVLMSVALIWCGNFAIGLTPVFTDLMFRRARESKTAWILAKTLVQIIVIWGLILFVIPIFIVRTETKLGIFQFSFPFQKIIAACFFVILSSIGVSAAVTMSRIGRGTPLPFDTAKILVVSGVYKFVRNPMAVSGIGQGLAVGLFLGSPLVLLYALMGGAIWQMIFRPLEEDDLAKNFGADFETYRKNVRCWIPKFRRYDASR